MVQELSICQLDNFFLIKCFHRKSLNNVEFDGNPQSFLQELLSQNALNSRYHIVLSDDGWRMKVQAVEGSSCMLRV